MIEAEKKAPDYNERMEHLRNIRDEDIDFSDAPEITDEAIARGEYRLAPRGGARPGAGRKHSGRVPLMLRVRPQLARRLRAVAKKSGRSMSEIAEERLAGV